MLSCSIPSSTDYAPLVSLQEKSAFSHLYDNYSAAIYSGIIKMVKQKDIAEDLLQDVFIKAWKYRDSYNLKKGTVFTWMVNISRHVCIDHLRSKYNRARPFICIDGYNEVDIPVLPQSNMLLHELKKNTLQLDVKLRNIIVMIYFMDYTQEEVATLLKIPVGTVKTRTRVGINQLRKLYGEKTCLQ